MPKIETPRNFADTIWAAIDENWGDAEACYKAMTALITAHSRTVPRAMLREVYNLSSIEWERSADAIAAKYGVKVEG